jgi:hypothetical protein
MEMPAIAERSMVFLAVEAAGAVLVAAAGGGISINSEGMIGMNLRGGIPRGLRILLTGLFMR